MPSYEWNQEYNAWTKSCSKCTNILVASYTEKKSIEFFSKSFSYNKQTLDGFDSICKACALQLTKIRTIKGLRPGQEELMFDKQKGKCDICKKQLSLERGTKNRACIDHEGYNIRGLLCRKCNTAIAYLNHDIKTLANAISYLAKNGHR